MKKSLVVAMIALLGACAVPTPTAPASPDPVVASAADREAKGSKVVWRVDLSGPHGIEELYLDQATGQLVDAITQGN